MAPTQSTGDLLPRHEGGNSDTLPEADGKKPAAFVRVWSVADEVRILEGLAAHVEAHGAPPRRSQLHGVLAGRGLDKAEFTVTEIYEKVRRLRTRYWNLRHAGGVAPGQGDGDEARRYELSTVIWGKETGPELAQPKVAKKEDAARLPRGFEEMRCLYPNLVLAVESIIGDDNRRVIGAVLKRAFQLMDDQEATKLDAKVKKHRVLESRMTMSRNTVRNEVLGTLIQSMD